MDVRPGPRSARMRTFCPHCQNNFKASALDEEVAQLSVTEFTPLGEGSGAVQLEIFAAVEMALPIEMIVYG